MKQTATTQLTSSNNSRLTPEDFDAIVQEIERRQQLQQQELDSIRWEIEHPEYTW